MELWINSLVKVVQLCRPRQPLRRTNPNKGPDEDPMWDPISWEEAYDLVASDFKKSIDEDPRKLQQYLAKNKLPWVQVYEPGGFSSPTAIQLGIAIVPTMMLIDKSGKVVNRNVAISDLDREVNRQFK